MYGLRGAKGERNGVFVVWILEKSRQSSNGRKRGKRNSIKRNEKEKKIAEEKN